MPVQAPAERVPGRARLRSARGRRILGPRPARGSDQRPAAERHPAVVGEQRADQALGEVRPRGGLLPPAGRDEVPEHSFPPFKPVLRLPVLQHVHVPVLRVGEQEPAGRVALVLPALEQQREGGVAAEADVGQPGAAVVGGVHDQGQVVERRPQAAVPVHPGGDPANLEAERLEQQRERPVQLVTESASAPDHDLVDQVVRAQRDRLGQVDAQVLERHRHLVRPVQRAQRRRVGRTRALDADPQQVFIKELVVHVPTVSSGGERGWRRPRQVCR